MRFSPRDGVQKQAGVDMYSGNQCDGADQDDAPQALSFDEPCCDSSAAVLIVNKAHAIQMFSTHAAQIFNLDAQCLGMDLQHFNGPPSGQEMVHLLRGLDEQTQMVQAVLQGDGHQIYVMDAQLLMPQNAHQSSIMIWLLPLSAEPDDQENTPQENDAGVGRESGHYDPPSDEGSQFIVEKAVVEEQRRIGQELHDSLGQELTSIAFLGRKLELKLKQMSLPEASDATMLVDMATHAMDQMRSAAHDLIPVDVGHDGNGLVYALSHLCHRVTDCFNLPCSFSVVGHFKTFDCMQATHLLRIAQEALNNALKHARASMLGVTLQQDDHRQVLMIEDDGIGMAPQVREFWGLRTMRERARKIGAELEVLPRDGGGTCVRCTLTTS